MIRLNQEQQKLTLGETEWMLTESPVDGWPHIYLTRENGRQVRFLTYHSPKRVKFLMMDEKECYKVLPTEERTVEELIARGYVSRVIEERE